MSAPDTRIFCKLKRDNISEWLRQELSYHDAWWDGTTCTVECEFKALTYRIDVWPIVYPILCILLASEECAEIRIGHTELMPGDRELNLLRPFNSKNIMGYHQAYLEWLREEICSYNGR